MRSTQVTIGVENYTLREMTANQYLDMLDKATAAKPGRDAIEVQAKILEQCIDPALPGEILDLIGIRDVADLFFKLQALSVPETKEPQDGVPLADGNSGT